jgi:hypothetical protein
MSKDPTTEVPEDILNVEVSCWLFGTKIERAVIQKSTTFSGEYSLSQDVLEGANVDIAPGFKYSYLLSPRDVLTLHATPTIEGRLPF